MKRVIAYVIITLIIIMSASAKENTAPRDLILKARYYPAAGSNVEHGQGAIERNELWHREIEYCVWLIRVEWPGNPREWEKKLTETVYDRNGTFTVEHATAEERRLVESGAIKLQK